MSLDGLAALVTGCGRRGGIGRAVALVLAENGADVAVTDVSTTGRPNAGEGERPDGDWGGVEALAAEIEALGRRSLAVEGDVGQRGDAERMVAASVERLGRLDILVNNAAAPHGADRNPTWQVPEDAYDEVMRVNAKGAFLMSTAFVRHVLAGDRRSGRIVNVASVAGLRGLPLRAAYSASKAALIGLTQAMAAELAEHGITVNAVCPGAVDTPRHAARGARGAASGAPPPVQRVGTPADVARAVLFLAEPTADYVTGQALVVDGGWSGTT